jgi:hypothetical protein
MRNTQWYIDQYNRNREYKDHINSYEELNKNKLTGMITKKGTKIVSYKQKLDGKRKETL